MARRSIPSRIDKSAPTNRLGDRSVGLWCPTDATAARRGYGHAWRKARAAFLAENPLCAMRGDGCTRAASVVDHIRPHRGDQMLFNDPENWQALCAHCHAAHKQRTESR